jgi:hypothetical protein
LSLRALWFILGLIRRAMVDVTVTAVVAFAIAIILGGGWRRTRLTWRSLKGRFQRFIADST